MGGPGSGRRPTPLAIKLRNGSYRRDRHGELVPLAEVIPLKVGALPDYVPPMPVELRQDGAALWNHIWTHLPYLRAADAPIVVRACRAEDAGAMAWRRYEATTEPRDLKGVETAMRIIEGAFKSLGMGPVERARLGLIHVGAVSKLDLLRRRTR